MPHEHLMVTAVPGGQLLDTTGDGTGSTDLLVDGSTTPVYFKLVVPPGHTYLLKSLMLSGQCAGLVPSGFLGGNALTNGLEFGIIKGGTFYSVMPQRTIKANVDWGITGAHAAPWTAGGEDTITVSFEFDKVYGTLRKLEDDEEYCIKVQDDLSSYGTALHVYVGYLHTHRLNTP